MRKLLAALAVLLLAGCAAPDDNFDFDSCGVRPRVRIPVAMHNGMPLVMGAIKGRPAVFVLDTGAVSVVLTEAARQRFELDVDPRTVMTGSGIGGQTRGFAGRIEGLQIGDLMVPDHRVSVLPADAAIAASGVDGLFGVSVLSVFEVDLDLPHEQVTLYAGHLCPDTVAPEWSARAVAVDASRSERGRFYVPVMVDGREVTALLDTGAATSLLSTRAALAVGVTGEMMAADPVITLAGTGPQRVRAAVHRFGEIGFAGQVFRNQMLVVTDLPEPNIDMIIGADYLARRHIWLSYARRRAFIEMPAK